MEKRQELAEYLFEMTTKETRQKLIEVFSCYNKEKEEIVLYPGQEMEIKMLFLAEKNPDNKMVEEVIAFWEWCKEKNNEQ